MNDILKQLLCEHLQDLSEERIEKILQFHDLAAKENEIQNLTRLIAPADFYFGHIQDVVELLSTGWIEYPALDLGSGVGIPGILAALLAEGDWVLA